MLHVFQVFKIHRCYVLYVSPVISTAYLCKVRVPVSLVHYYISIVGHVTSTIALKCQLPRMLKLAMQLIVCTLQDSSAHFPHLKSVNLSMLNSTVKRDVYQLRGLYHAGNEACSVLIKHVLPPGIFQVGLAAFSVSWILVEAGIMLWIYQDVLVSFGSLILQWLSVIVALGHSECFCHLMQ